MPCRENCSFKSVSCLDGEIADERIMPDEIRGCAYDKSRQAFAIALPVGISSPDAFRADFYHVTPYRLVLKNNRLSAYAVKATN